MAGKIQKQDVKTESELTGAGATAADLINDTQIYVSGASINKTLDDAIVDGDVVRPDVVTNAKLANAPAWTLKGRNNAASGDPEDIALADFTEEATPAAGDFVVGHLSTGELRKFDIGNLPSGGGQSLNTQDFTASGNFVVPSGVTEVEIIGVGGGGGGGGNGASGGSTLGGGGGGGCIPRRVVLPVTPAESLTVTIGSGGGGGAGGGAAAGTAGSTGGNSSVAGGSGTRTFYGAAGGAGGISSAISNSKRSGIADSLYTLGGARPSGSAENGEADEYAAGGARGGAGTNNGGGGGAGIGVGGAGGTTTVGVAAAANSGAGGGGGGSSGATARAGGAGGSGFIQIRWFA